MKRIMFVTAAVITAICIFSSGCAEGQAEAYSERTDFVFNTVIRIRIYAENDLSERCMDEIFAELSRIEKIASSKDVDSELYKLNLSAASRPVSVSDTLFELIEQGVHYGELSGGAFDISLGKLIDLWGIGTKNESVPEPSEIDSLLPDLGYEKIRTDKESRTVFYENENIKIDLGGITKGYSADKAHEILLNNGITKAVLDFGGNIYVLGSKDGKGWRVDINDPLSPGEAYKTLFVSDTSVVTSGNYERYFEIGGVKYHHIFDRNTGYPADSGIISATVITEASVTADALSTAFFVLGADGAQQILDKINNTEIEVMLINGQGEELSFGGGEDA